MISPKPTPLVLLAPMEGLLDFVLRDILTRVGGIDRCVSEFIRITDQLLPERVFTRIVPELHNGGHTFAGVPVRAQLLGSDPACMADNAARLADIGILYIDAPNSGGAARAASGEMTMMSAGKPEAYEMAEPFLRAMAGTLYKLGDKAGAGSKVKVINQLLAGVHIAAAAEAMALGLREGVDPAALYEVITHSAGNSWMFENRMAHVLAADYTPLSAVDIFVKDLGLVLDMARASKFPLPLSSTAHQMFMQASTAGFAKEDDSAVIKIFPGIELPKKHA